MHFLNAGTGMGLIDKTGIERKEEQNKRRCTGLGMEGSAYKKGKI